MTNHTDTNQASEDRLIEVAEQSLERIESDE